MEVPETETPDALHLPKRLGFIDSYLTVWILGAMILGVLVGYFSPSSANAIDGWSSGSVNWPIAIGLIVMMFPPLARVNYDQVFSLLNYHWKPSISTKNTSKESPSTASLIEVSYLLSKTDSRCGEKCLCHENALISGEISEDSEESKFKRLLLFSIILNWIVGPFLMFFLAIAFLPDNNMPYIRGLIMVGLARCIAMVIVWNDLASGSPEYATILVCLNSFFQIVCYSPYAYFFISIFLPLFHLPGSSQEMIFISFALVAESVAIYLGIPFALGLSCWLIFNRFLSADGWKEWYKSQFVPRTAPLTLLALLFTIIVMFILKGHLIVSIPLQVVRVAAPLCVYFCIMFVGVYYSCYKLGFTAEQAITLSFTSASNNFELAIAVSIAVFGLDSPEAFVGVIGPLVEVPVMLGFVHLIKILQMWWPAQPSDVMVHQTPYMNVHDDVELSVVPAEVSLKNVLFLCTGNSCRSHMAQGWCWFYHRATLNLAAYSAGTSPEPNNPGAINPFAVKVMMEYGIDISEHRSKNVSDLLNEVDFHLVVTVCDDAAQHCPTIVGGADPKILPRIVHHSFDDPSGLVERNSDSLTEEEVMEVYRKVCEEIRLFVRDALPQLIH